MSEASVQKKLLTAGFLFLMPDTESLPHHSLQDMVTRSFLLSLWWKELACIAALLCLAAAGAARIALHGTAEQTAPSDPNTLNLAERLKELAE